MTIVIKTGYNLGGLSPMNDHELMFELSHPERLETLRMLSKESHRLTDLSKVLDITSAEVSRHLGRLTKAQLIIRNGEGRYILTSLGTIVLNELSKFNFLISHNQYFLTHDLFAIPDELRQLSPMSKCEFVKGTLEIMSVVEDLSRDAKRHIRILSEQPMRTMRDITLQKAKDGVDVKIIYTKGSEIPDSYRTQKGLPLEVRLLDEVPFAVKLNEKSAGVALPDLNGKILYDIAMMGSKPVFVKWAQHLFDYYWQKASLAF